MMHASVDHSLYDRLVIYYLQGKVLREPPACTGYIGTWQEEDSAFVFFHRKADDVVQRLISLQPELQLIDRYEMSYDEWQGERPQRKTLGDFTIVPQWDACRSDDVGNNRRIVMDPGVVFGNGDHPTTQDCMEAIGLAVASTPVATAVDLGTGTGILSLAAWKSGVRHVVALDLNRLAVQTAQRNFRINGALDHILAIHARAEDCMDMAVDLMIANIHFDIMKRLIASSGFLRKRQFILSGLLRSEVREVEATLSRLPVTILRKWERDGIWHTIWGKIPPDAVSYGAC